MTTMQPTLSDLPMPQIRIVRILHLDGRVFASAGFERVTSAWGWVAATVAREHNCDEDDVRCKEGPGGEEFVTVRGLTVYLFDILC